MSQDDLDTLVPQPRKVTFRGREVEIAPLQLRQVSAFATATRPIIGRAVLAASMLERGESLGFGAVLFDMLEQDAAGLAGALALATGLPADEIGEGTLHEVVHLAEVVVEVNHDFFARRLPQVMERLRPAAAQLPRPAAHPPADPPPPPATPPDGSTSPSTSSATDTGSETS